MVETLKSDNKLWDYTAAKIFSDGVSNAIIGLSKMVERDIGMSDIRTIRVPVKEIPDIFGGRENLIVGVYLSIVGDSKGHIFVAYEPQTAFDLIDMLLGQPAGSTGQGSTARAGRRRESHR